MQITFPRPWRSFRHWLEAKGIHWHGINESARNKPKDEFHFPWYYRFFLHTSGDRTFRFSWCAKKQWCQAGISLGFDDDGGLSWSLTFPFLALYGGMEWRGVYSVLQWAHDKGFTRTKYSSFTVLAFSIQNEQYVTDGLYFDLWWSWRMLTDPDESNYETDPWWAEACGSLLSKTFGPVTQQRLATTVTDYPVSFVMASYGEDPRPTTYEGKVTVEHLHLHCPWMPWADEEWLTAAIEIEEPPGHPGKGTCAHNIDDDAIYAIHNIKVDSLASAPDQAVLHYVNAVQRNRDRYPL